MEWEAPALVLSAVPYGESSVIAHVLTGEHGLYHGMVRGGASRQGRPVWQAGNLITARWSARVPDQLGGLRGELVHASAARVLDFALPLAMLASMCALADASLPEREPHLAVFQELTRLLACISLDPVDAEQTGMAALIRWEALLLSDLGFGLDLSCCAVSGQKHDLKWVSPRSGRAVSDGHAGQWRDRLLALPPFLLDPAQDGTPAGWLAGLRLTGHFLARDAFGQRHRPLPAARIRLLDMVARMAENGDIPDDSEGGA
ncbi:DNA repair protein RecO [Gluconacetobacter entanii]|uniref:DNA repair protein RecO n=1 Tax=Gluconacetobacter entanii TaxID=108528 RepID=UPI001C931F86|nr:DNA repair protein RecO [Gluconacetobacter entanii]MBY4640710.1 DNA repair protein RecO [Gluconacetobacter entanii]MCW4581904.1 DNA repair protein RecO [Gluconacetobacter entanii]MCW4585354.1 DNA repair protein RecO [Gluconacetobacter entanii]MCW4588931.1 DNA repair protein RecO [Gluconacetobacter entanii]